MVELVETPGGVVSVAGGDFLVGCTISIGELCSAVQQFVFIP